MRNGLRVYINSAGVDALGEPEVFYSRRACGPYYRWCYEQAHGKWRSSRLHPSILESKAFCLASWSIVPPALQLRLDEHYME